MKHTTMKAMLTAVIVAAGTVTALGEMPARYVLQGRRAGTRLGEGIDEALEVTPSKSSRQ